MDDHFLESQRREPDPGFARRLRAHLDTLDTERAPRPLAWLRPALAAGLAVLVGVGLFTVPAMRVRAQQLLDLFRVQDFAVVQVDEGRMEQLRERVGGMDEMLGRPVEHVSTPEHPERFATVAEAERAAGFRVEQPAVVPGGYALDSVMVSPDQREVVAVDVKPLRELMDAFQVRDLPLPASLDGSRVTLHMKRAVVQRYRGKRDGLVLFMQAPSPEVELPPGTDLAQLGEIGLRLLGLDRGEASRLARSIDWRSTLLVPVVGAAGSYQAIDVNGARGLYLDGTSVSMAQEKGRGRGAVVLWTRDGVVHALGGPVGKTMLLQMAESVR